MEWYHVYLFTRLEAMHSLLEGLLIVGALLIMAHIMASFIWEGSRTVEEDEAMKKKLQKRNPYVIGLYLMIVIAKCALPTEKEAAAIYMFPKLAKSDFAKEASQLPTDAAKLMRIKLEEWIADASKTKK